MIEPGPCSAGRITCWLWRVRTPVNPGLRAGGERPAGFPVPVVEPGLDVAPSAERSGAGVDPGRGEVGSGGKFAGPLAAHPGDVDDVDVADEGGDAGPLVVGGTVEDLSLIHISEPTRRTPISYAVF